MNTKLSTVFNAHADEMRELSHSEQIQTSGGGGRTCYQSLKPGQNGTRLRDGYNAFVVERYNRSQRRYVIITLYTKTGNFDDLCRSKGYNVIVG
jgi:hypothetical protein